MYEAEIKILEAAINKILPGLQMYVRDVNLPPQTAAKYKTGIILREPAFCDASARVGGMIMSHRFAILSNQCFNADQYGKDTGWGLHICQRDSFFKVLDVYEYSCRTQITLLHLDKDYWQLFQNVQADFLDGLVTSCRERFEKKCLLTAIPELAAKEWLERCVMPIGIDDNNEFYPIPQKEPLMPQNTDA